MTLKITIGACSQAGAKEHNEDSYGVMLPDVGQELTKGIAIAIADGMSQSSAAKEASETCVKCFLLDYFGTPNSWTVKRSASQILNATNRWMCGQGKSGDDLNMVSTLSAMVLKSTSAHIFHIGDSRISLLRGGSVEPLTTDHRMQGYGGNIMLNRAMGTNVHLDIDYRIFSIRPQDIFIFTTDGVHETVPSPRIKEIIGHHENDLDQAARDIVDLAISLGSLDNVTCQIIRIDDMQSEDDFMSAEQLPFPPDLHAGQILDGYKIIRELHANSRSQVYLAQDELTEKYVALKTPSVNFDDDARYIELFRREEWVGLQINNPHVLRYLPPREGRQFLYIVTEYIDGQSLRQWMNDNPKPDMAKVRAIVEQVIRGLRIFHRLDMLHQDLKPENIMIDGAGTVKIIDLGSVYVASLEEGRKSDKLPAGAVDYTAPEYILYGGGDRLSDIYALGVVIYEMLTHQLPYGKALSTVQNIRRLSYIPARTLNSDILPWLEPVLEKAVKKEPKERYQQLSELEYDLKTPKKMASSAMPLLSRNPVLFWKILCLVLSMIILLQLYE